MGPRSWRCHANWFITESTDERRIPDSNDSHWCLFKMHICLPGNWSDSNQCSQSNNRHRDERFIFTDNSHEGQRSAFTSTIIAEITQILGITLECATINHPQTIGKLEWTHASLKTNLKMVSGEYRRQWHKYLPLAVLIYNTTYQSSIGCEPRKVFHGRIPFNGRPTPRMTAWTITSSRINAAAQASMKAATNEWTNERRWRQWEWNTNAAG